MTVNSVWPHHQAVPADLNVGVLYITAVTSIAVYGITLAGWSSNNKYAMLGGLRSTAQMISYELALGLSLLCRSILLAGSMSMVDIVEAQKHPVWVRCSINPAGGGDHSVDRQCWPRSTARRLTCPKPSRN